MNRRNVTLKILVPVALAVVTPITACADDPPATVAKKAKAAAGKDRSESAKNRRGQAEEPVLAEARVKSDPLTRENFGPEMRDPFRSFLIDETIQAAEEAPVIAERQREVHMRTYNFEDLSLIGIIRSKRGVEPRALFVATDGISGTIKQGQYFSRAEVLLSSVNTGYVEIEIVDENLAKGLNLTNGETRAIYLKRE